MSARILISTVVYVSMFVSQQVHAQDESVMPEATELEGTWEVVSYVATGEQFELNLRWRFEGNRLYRRRGDDENWRSVGTFSLDASATPAEVDFDYDSGYGAPGIYELDGDTLTICEKLPPPLPLVRPDVFHSTEEYSTILIVLRRVEEESE